jgi:hypothetical protein
VITSDFSDDGLRIVREKAFQISQVLDDTIVDVTASGLGLAGFKKLLAESKKKHDPEDSGKSKNLQKDVLS